MSRIAVAILNYNGEKLLRQFLPSVIQNSGSAEIFVIDNGSTDGSKALIRNEYQQVKIIELQSNFGFCGGYNRGLQQIQADYYVLLNSDIEVTHGWLDPMAALLQGDDIAAVQPRVLAFHQKNKFEYAGAAGGFVDSLGYPFCRGRLFDFTEEDRGQYADTREVFWGSGACLMIRSSVYWKFNGLDEDLFAHMEEIDLCWKINRAGLKVYYCGSSVVYHVGAGTLSYESPRKTYLNFRNGLTLLYKHLDPLELFYKILLRMILDWAAALLFIFRGSFANASAVFKAHFHFLKAIRKNHQKRKQIRSVYPSYSRRQIYHGLVIIDYFIKGRRSIELSNPR